MRATFTKLHLVILFVLASAGLVLFLSLRNQSDRASEPAASRARDALSSGLAAEVARLEATEREMNRTVWAKEILAQECGRTFEALWDSINASTNKLGVIAAFAPDEIVMPAWKAPQALPHGIELWQSSGDGTVVSAGEFRQAIEKLQRDGWELNQVEFRHNRFETHPAGEPRQSRFYFSAHLANSTRPERAVIDGDIVVDWGARLQAGELVPIKRIDATGLTLKTRPGKPPFEPILVQQIAPQERSSTIDPLIVFDLDGDAVPEIILVASNLIYHRDADGRYKPEPLCRLPARWISTAIIADFDGNGSPDLLCAKYEGFFLFKGSARGTFEDAPQKAWSPDPMLDGPQVLTCGDIDRDGDLDVFLGQYKDPYDGGAMPTPFHDANDGFPSYLLLNDGHGNFSDQTKPAGLANKRWRRVFSSSFADLDGDRDLDLVVVSDFAGVDAYRNDGAGRFQDVTAAWIPEPHAFGMAHTLADFNADGRLDLLMIGMTAPTVDRLEHLGLRRPGAAEDPTMRARMTYGNRLYVGRADGGFEQTPLSESIARSGWSWGSSAFDFDNDGFTDAYIANGHESNASVRDYEPEYWLRDMYVGNSQENQAAYFYFKGVFNRTRGRDHSYGGYEKNRFYLNQRGASFTEIGHLLGLALETDSRNAVADDLDGDGRVDLVVTTTELWPKPRQTLRAYRNVLETNARWIGFRLRGEGTSPIGARVTLRIGHRSVVRTIVTGDSYRSQHSTAMHFGLGAAAEVDSVEIAWPNGATVMLQKPALNRYHSVSAPPSARRD